ncbi:hypothetical protein K0504_07850 [Neiella marina]|uniref:Uncharacterized protein n=1 Tax=Neiella holothuriorum TaxID=2870530 RepID=A0ABS7EF28_9GAMM|nr:hypothetical protein [Neiella holothuriorum]MBW8190947.1 hypothetical protein [Neiella holothuriorum]
MSKIFAFVKLFENRDYAEDFVNGKLFMNTIRSFKEYKDESGELRGDEYEGVVALYQPDKLGEIRLGEHTIPASDLAAPIVIHGNNLLDHNVFCIYSLNSRGHETVSSETISDFKRTLELHESCFGLGKFCVVITNASQFIARCRSAIEKINLKGNLGLVDYFNEDEFHGSMPGDKLGYQKRSLFSQQREYRVKVDINRTDSSPYILDIGNLNDIAVITTPKEFNSKLELKLPDGSNA